MNVLPEAILCLVIIYVLMMIHLIGEEVSDE